VEPAQLCLCPDRGHYDGYYGVRLPHIYHGINLPALYIYDLYITEKRRYINEKPISDN
jgi:hypothetical protein